MAAGSNFYVYVHRREDTGAPFYVGKGKGRRAHVKQHRNPYWLHIVAKAGYNVQIAASGLDEELAHLAEVELINKYRMVGTRLANLTDGGEGMSGFKVPRESVERGAAKRRGVKRPDVSARMKGVPKSAEHKDALSRARAGFKCSEQVRQAMSESRKGRPGPMLGKTHRPESKAKTSAALSGEKNPFFGKTHSPEMRAQLSASHKGFRHSEDTRQRMSAAHSGEKNIHFGVEVSPERKAKQIATLMARPLLTCPHCSSLANDGNAKRWHFDNCMRKSA